MEINQEPYVMYLIVRESLNMSAGKIAAQVGHAVEMLMDEFHLLESLEKRQMLFNKDREQDLNNFDAWQDDCSRKVVLKADEKEWAKIKDEVPNKFIVTDLGLTEIEPNTETVIGLVPMKKSEATKIIKKLQTLK